ncbi:metallophosphoesterase family protein [Sphingomonas sp. 1P06PA]|uniref:metallophosphoesterase family protein n=1 Tax=Sphingomonas sp. 1P06PA TaxID=554121 RepID=UPI0039A72F81
MVLRRILKRAPEPASWTIPDGQRVYAVGDIHGRADLLGSLIEQIEADDRHRGPALTTIIFLGDLIDRGADSRGVVERLMALKAERPRVRILLGNHEEVMLKALAGDRQALRMLIRIGGRSTLISYGIGEGEIDAGSFDDLGQRLEAAVPDTHVKFLSGFEDHVRIGDYLFVHAGIRPGVAIERQRTSDLRWIRGDFLDHDGKHGLVVVHGHSVTEAVDERHNRIGIDTGAFASGRLTALGIEGASRWYLST